MKGTIDGKTLNDRGVTTTMPFWSSHLDTDTRLLLYEDTYVKIPGKDTYYVEARSYVESPLVKEECEPLIDWIIDKEPSNTVK